MINVESEEILFLQNSTEISANQGSLRPIFTDVNCYVSFYNQLVMISQVYAAASYGLVRSC